MADRRVRRTAKTDGDIPLCAAALIGRRSLRLRSFRTLIPRPWHCVHEVAPSVDVTAVDGRCGKHLRTVADRTSANNLDNPPNC